MKSLTLACVLIAISFGSVAQPCQTPVKQSEYVGQDPHAMSKPKLETVQQALVKAGYKTPTDGIWNDVSAAALVSFQANRALATTHGGIDGSTLSALGLGGKL